MRALRSSALSSILAALTISLFGSGAAHGVEIISTEPAIDATVAVSPNFVTVTADQDLLDFGNQLTVISPSNKRVDDGLLTVSGATLSVGVTELTESGKYLVEYELLVAEDSPVFGNFSFVFQAPPSVSEETPTATPTDPSNENSDGNTNGEGSKTTDYIVIGLLVFAFFVLVWLARFARSTFRKE